MNAQEQRFWDNAVISFAAALMSRNTDNLISRHDCIGNAAELADTALQERRKRVKHIADDSEDEKEDTTDNVVFKPTEQHLKSFERFKGWMEENTPLVCKMKNKLTVKQLCILTGLIKDSTGNKIEIQKAEVYEYLLQIENNKEYLKKYNCAYSCIRRWHKQNQK